MNVETTIPTTRADLAEMGYPERIPATWEEFLDCLESAEFNVEYDNQHIIIMSYATNRHEQIVLNFGTVSNILFEDDEDILVLGSSRPVYHESWGERSYNPDVHIVVGEVIEIEYRQGMTANANPAVIFEVLSPSTAQHDWNDKLPRYKKMPSVRQIIYIEQSRPYVTVFTRIGNTDQWINVAYDRLEQSFEVLGKQVALKKLYQKVIFTEKQ